MKHRMKAFLKAGVVLAVLAFVMVTAIATPRSWMEHWSHQSGLPIDAILVPPEAHADTAGGGAAAAPAAMGPSCSNDGTLASGLLTQQAPCIANFKRCAVFYAGNGSTPAVGALSCQPTSTTTVISAATVTVSAVSIIQSSPAGAPTVTWVGGPF